MYGDILWLLLELEKCKNFISPNHAMHRSEFLEDLVIMVVHCTIIQVWSILCIKGGKKLITGAKEEEYFSPIFLNWNEDCDVYSSLRNSTVCGSSTLAYPELFIVQLSTIHIVYPLHYYTVSSILRYLVNTWFPLLWKRHGKYVRDTLYLVKKGQIIETKRMGNC